MPEIRRALHYGSPDPRVPQKSRVLRIRGGVAGVVAVSDDVAVSGGGHGAGRLLVQPDPGVVADVVRRGAGAMIDQAGEQAARRVGALVSESVPNKAVVKDDDRLPCPESTDWGTRGPADGSVMLSLPVS